MKGIVLFFVIFSAYAILFACSTDGRSSEKTAPPEPLIQESKSNAKSPAGGWKIDWEKSLSTARKEGKVSIISGQTENIRQEFNRLFKKNFNLDIEWTLVRGGEGTQKIMTERRAGLFLYDIHMSGLNNVIATLKPNGILETIRPELLLPEVTDTSKWIGNGLPWVDKEGLMLAPGLAPSSSILINTDLVKVEEISSYLDLLESKWKGKILVSNPTVSGPGQRWVTVVGGIIMGWDYIKKLINNDLSVAADDRQVVDWVARGKYAVAIGPSGGIVDNYKKEGASLELVHAKEGTYQTTGYTPIVLLRNRPHPYAARIFINWYLSREGQQVLADYDLRQGTRVDIDTSKIPSVKLRKPGEKYINVDTEEFYISEVQLKNTTVEMFRPLVR